MLAHINHLRSLHDQLKEMGQTIDDKELAMTVLASLPEEFKPLTRPWMLLVRTISRMKKSKQCF